MTPRAVPSALNGVTYVAVLAGAVSLGFALWQLLVVADSLSGLWLVFWAMVFGPVFLAIGAAHLWRAFRDRGRP
jgi:hypothetical protein